MSALTAHPQGFLLRGEPLRIISGAMHYFRVHPDQWADRLSKARLMGLNSIETYVPWSLHEPTPGTLELSGLLDLPRYLRLAQEEGLHVLLRPGPYICAEFDGGGLPGWLTADADIRLRSSDPRFTGAVDGYFDLLLPQVLPYLAASGGPVIAVQVENEYGAYGDDAAYLRHLVQALRARGVDELLFTCDQANPEHLRAGSTPGVLATGTFGSKAALGLETLRTHRPESPLMCSEFWIGWFDHWGGPHHTRDAADAAAELDVLLAAGASVNFYMFHGGTNVGFTNGANHHDAYTPTITSYDYDAPLTEAGDPGPKYHAFREVISRYAPVPDEPAPVPGPRLPPVTVVLDRVAPLLATVGELARPVRAASPLTMGELGQHAGFTLYRSTLPSAGSGELHVAGGVGDRAQVFVDGVPAGVLERERGEDRLAVDVPRPGADLDVLVENLGRVNYGPHIGDRKGLPGPVSFNGIELGPWDCFPLPLRDLGSLSFGPVGVALPPAPAFYTGTFTVREPADTFLALPGWTKGQAWVNDVNLGRYWDRGPQRTLYVPGPVLRAGGNTLTLLELHGTEGARAYLVDAPDLG